MSWRRILLLSMVLVIALVATTLALLQNSSAATEFVRRSLSAALAPQVDVAATTIELQAGRLSVSGLEVHDPTAPGRRLLRVPSGHVDLQIEPFGDGVALRHVLLEGAEIELGPTWPTAAQLFVEQSDSGAGVPTLPVIELRGGSAKLHLCADEPPLELSRIDVHAVPLAAAPKRLQLQGTVELRDPVASLTLRGEIDVETGGGWFSLETGGIELSQLCVARLLDLADVEVTGLAAGGRLESLTAICRLPPSTAADRTPTLELKAELADALLHAEELPDLVRRATVSVHVDTAADEVHALFRQRDEVGDLQVTTRVRELSGEPRVDLRARGRDVRVDDDVLTALRAFPIGRRVVDALAPTDGRADIDLYLEDPHRRGGDVELDLRLFDVAMSFQGFEASEDRRIGFPLPLEHASGRVVLRDGVILLRDMQAQITPAAGGGSVTVRGRIDVDRPRGEDLSLDIRGVGLAFGNDLREALATLLPETGAALYDDLGPEGRADVAVLVRPGSELDGQWAVSITPRDAAMRWRGFPYRLDDLRGSIRVRHRTARFDLTGRHGDGGLTMRGRIPMDRDDHTLAESFEAVIDLEQLAVDQDLRDAVVVVEQDLAAHWDDAQPVGRLSGRVKVRRAPGDDEELSHDVRLLLEGVDLQLPVARWRALDLRGQVLIQGRGADARVDFDALRGELVHDELVQGGGQPARLALLGSLRFPASTDAAPAPIDVERDLAFVVRDLELSEQLGLTLGEQQLLGKSTWDALRPSGRVDLVCLDRQRLAAPHDLQLVVQLLDVRSDAPMLPRTAEHMTGELHVEGGELTFREVRGKLGNADVQCANGRVRRLPAPDGRSEISFDVHAEDFPVDDGIANLFSGPLQEAVRERNLRGIADVDSLSLRFLVPTDDDSEHPFSTTIRGSIELGGVDMQLGRGSEGIRLQDLQGLVTLAESTVTESGGQLVGTIGRGSLSLFGHPFEAVDAVFHADATKLELDALKTRIHAGELRNATPGEPALTYLLPAPNVPEGRLRADLAFEDVDVFSLLNTGGWQNPPYTGIASGRLTLHRLDGNDVVGAEADGTLRIERANLGRVPLFTAIYAQLPSADQPRFNELDLRYRVDTEAMVFEQLDIRSDIIAAKGRGTLDLDGYLDIEMSLDNLLGQSADPLVMPLIDYLAKNLVTFRLYGHLRNLQARTDFAGSNTPGRSPVLPMPPERPRPGQPGF